MLSLPSAAQRKLGHELHRVQQGESPSDWKAMRTIGAGVLEIRAHADGAFRLLYVAKFAECIYVLHVFQKKTEKTSQLDLAVARARLTALRRSRIET